jgi:phosphatidate phosphatase APP1
MSRVFISDIDGTIANCSHRLHFIQNGRKDWTGFFEACGRDEPIVDVIELLQRLEEAGSDIIYLSGRSDEVRSQTELWLYNHDLPAGPLFMRKRGDHRLDSIVKSELMDNVLEIVPRENIAGIFDDRQQVVDMWRKRGFRVYQVAAGDF